MTKEEIERYLKYVEDYERTEEAEAISCIRIYGGCVADDKWIDIKKFHKENGTEQFEFDKIRFATYHKILSPQYPNCLEFENEWVYRQVCHGITYETANKDIELQKRRGVQGKNYVLKGRTGRKGYSAVVTKI